jgi:hypothetical protein
MRFSGPIRTEVCRLNRYFSNRRGINARLFSSVEARGSASPERALARARDGEVETAMVPSLSRRLTLKIQNLGKRDEGVTRALTPSNGGLLKK